MARFVPLLTAATLLAAPAAAQVQTLNVSNPWIRFITPDRPAAGYFDVTNTGTKPVIIAGASSPACGSVTLHQSRNEGGAERMEMVSRVTVPAHGGVSFKPGGYHLMCMSPNAQMKIGAQVPVTLRFGDNHDMTKPFTVRGPTGK